MENPFVFGKAVEGSYFTDRTEDAARLEANLTHGINTILISPRRWGKTSLVKKVAGGLDRADLKVVFIDVFQCKSEYDFYRMFATSVIRQTSSRMEEWVEMAKGFLANISPKLSFGTDPLNDFTLSFEWNPKEDTADSILSLPEKIAERKNVRLVVCLDEFQQVADIQEGVTFQKKMRSVWQHQQRVTYCMFGSKKHLMENIFNDKSMPFYKFGDMMFLRKIATEDWVPFICGKFAATGKTITEAQAARICSLTECLSSYVQHMAWLVWFKAGDMVADRDIDEALEILLEQNSAFFQREVEQMTAFQLNMLRAIADGVTSGFSGKETLRKYRLESSANVQSIRRALIKKDLVYQEGEELCFDDPLLKLWIRRL